MPTAAATLLRLGLGLATALGLAGPPRLAAAAAAAGAKPPGAVEALCLCGNDSDYHVALLDKEYFEAERRAGRLRRDQRHTFAGACEQRELCEDEETPWAGGPWRAVPGPVTGCVEGAGESALWEDTAEVTVRGSGCAAP